ncbi:MAG: Gfo/Idh/MocA family oxidoreductase [Planctomycetaceae bacterium]|jgi:predicted dehydrogenase|nr:Gfo/Idh/MocA family oxidoreductase [Planctomycetaceae bacterium]
MSRFVSRRRFLEDSLLGITAVAGAAYAASAVTLAQQSAGSVAATDKVGIAIIGSGGRAGDHINQHKGNPQCTILYIVDPDATRMSDKLIDDIASTQGGLKPQRVADMRRVFDDKTVDAVSCATTNHWHALAGIWACQAGKHVYVEKPGSHNIYEGLALAAASKKYNRVVQIGTQCRSCASNINAVAFIREGGIGEVNFARGLCYKRRTAIGAKGNFPIPENIDYDLWSGPAPIRSITRRNFHYDWHWQRLYGNGDLGNQGPHQTDIARWSLGVERYPRAIIAYGGRLGYDKENPNGNDPNYIDAGDTANTVVSIYDYGDKCIVFETRGLATPSLRIPNAPKDDNRAGASIGVITYGSKGYVVQSEYEYSAAYDLEGNRIREFKGGGDHFRNFINAVVKGDPSAVHADAACGALSSGLSHLGNISYYLGEANKVSVSEIRSALRKIKSLDDNDATVDRTVEHLKASKVDLDQTPMSVGPLLQFDHEAKRFIGNDDANAMLTREYRVPYVVPKPENV